MAPQPRPPLFGFAVVLLGATLFGTLGPVSHFVYEAGMEPIPFVAWRALLGALTVGVFVAWRIQRGSERLVRPSSLARGERTSLAIAAACGAGLNIAMFVAFDRIAVALALLCFYTYPAMIAVLDIASGREQLDRPKWIALGLALGGMVAVVASQLDPSAGVELDGIGVALALFAAVCQTLFVHVSRDGYRRIPADQATTVIISAAFFTCVALALATGTGAALTFPLANPSVWPLLLFTGVFAAAVPVAVLPHRHPGHRRHAGRDRHAVRTGRRRRPGGSPPERAAPADPVAGRRRHPGRRGHPPADDAGPGGHDA